MLAPLVSIIIPTYNYGRFLSEAVDSALAQTHEPLEVIVVDDGSTDDTSEVLKGYGDRIVAIHQENGGPSAARNAGMSRMRGEFFAFLDSDDRMAPEFVETLLADFERMPAADSIVATCRLTMESGRSFVDVPPEGWLDFRFMLAYAAGEHTLPTLGSCFLHRKKVWDEVGEQDLRFFGVEDLHYLLRMSLRHRIHASACKEPLVTVQRHFDSVSHDILRSDALTLQVLEDIHSRDDLPQGYDAEWKRAFAMEGRLAWSMTVLYRQRKMAACREYFWRLVRINPRNLLRKDLVLIVLKSLLPMALFRLFSRHDAVSEGKTASS